jgi:hypothetical protein
MKKIITILMIGVMMTSCSVHTTDNVDIDASDIQYVKDDRTGLCFGIVASRKSFDTDATGLGVTCVPCEKVEKYLKK